MARVTPGTNPWGAALNEDLNSIETLAQSALSQVNGRLSVTELPETIRDVIGATLVAGANVTISPNDAGDSITISATGGTGGTGTDPEGVRDTIAAALVGGTGITITPSDAADTITITSTSVPATRTISDGTYLTGGGDLSANRTLDLDIEALEDHLATTFLLAGPNVTFSYDDTNGSLTISAATPTSVPAGAIDSGMLNIERLTPGSTIVVDYYKNVYGAANAWPTSRPTTRVDITVNWIGPSDPGTIALAGDILDIDPV